MCKAYIDTRIKNAEQLIADAREAISNETKSSAGDKYETTREMMQQDIDMATMRMSDAKQQLQVLERIDALAVTDRIIPGSLVYTDKGNFYVAINAGQLKINNVSYQTISLTAPIGQAMKGLAAGNNFTFNSKQYRIDKIE